MSDLHRKYGINVDTLRHVVQQYNLSGRIDSQNFRRKVERHALIDGRLAGQGLMGQGERDCTQQIVEKTIEDKEECCNKNAFESENDANADDILRLIGI